VEVINGPEEMRRCVRRLIKEGVDLLKLNLSGEEITSCTRGRDSLWRTTRSRWRSPEARRRGRRICGHARSAESIKLCVKVRDSDHLSRKLRGRRSARRA
jgi:hypothetical protein